MKNDLVTIKCPVCGQEYLPNEIFMPDVMFGKQKEVIRDQAGNIEYYLGDDQDFNEEFICENCGAKLSIHANLSFDVEANTEDEWEDEYVTPIEKPKKIALEDTSLF